MFEVLRGTKWGAHFLGLCRSVLGWKHVVKVVLEGAALSPWGTSLLKAGSEGYPETQTGLGATVKAQNQFSP